MRLRIICGTADIDIDQGLNMKEVYVYGMRLRGFSIGCQPKDGLVERRDDKSGLYYDVLVYERELTRKELDDYELDFLGEETWFR